MTAWMLCCWLSAGAPAEGARPVVLLAEEAEYKAAKEPEAVFEGVLERNPGSGRIGPPTRFHAYRLTVAGDKPAVHDLYVPGKAFLLAGSVGQRVRLVGKLVSVEVDGKTQRELWPARLEPLTSPRQPPAPVVKTPVDDVRARCGWQPPAARRRGVQHFVFRQGPELAHAMQLSGESAPETAAALLARQLGQAAIDWEKHMVVTVAAGLRGSEVDRLTVTRLQVKDKTLTIFYRLMERPGGVPGFGYPAETVLVDRFDGPVHVEEDKSPPAREPAPK
jgi:hypothetical protein